MAAKSLEATVRRLPGAVPIPVIDLQGEIDSQAEGALNRAYDAGSVGSQAVVLNFAGVTYINSTGIALIVGLLARARKAGCRLMACGLSDHYVEIFKITRLVDFMPTYPDEVGAASALRAEQGLSTQPGA